MRTNSGNDKYNTRSGDLELLQFCSALSNQPRLSSRLSSLPIVPAEGLEILRTYGYSSPSNPSLHISTTDTTYDTHVLTLLGTCQLILAPKETPSRRIIMSVKPGWHCRMPKPAGIYEAYKVTGQCAIPYISGPLTSFLVSSLHFLSFLF